KYGKLDITARGMTGPKNATGETTWGGLACEVRYWGDWVLQRVKGDIGDLYPPLPDPKHRGKIDKYQLDWLKDHDPKEVPHGFLTPVAYLWSRTVTCKNPKCGAAVPLVRQTWLCKKPGSRKKPGRYVALRMVAPESATKVDFVVVEAETEEGLGFDPSRLFAG